MSKKFDDTSWVQIRSLSPPTIRLTGCSFEAATAANERRPSAKSR